MKWNDCGALVLAQDVAYLPHRAVCAEGYSLVLHALLRW
jgi:hypothetical protein